MPTTTPAAATRARLFVREDLPEPARQCERTATARLEDLASDDHLAEASVSSWAKRVPLAASDAPERRRYEEFLAWADDEDVRLGPFFDTRECYSAETAELRRELVTPAVCLALYAGEDLVYVAPHADESETVSVPACLDRLERAAETDRDWAATVEVAE